MRFVMIAASMIVLASCGLPRGGAIQSEVIGKEAQESAEFAVYRVSRETLSTISRWPQPSTTSSCAWPGKGRPAADKPIRPFDRVDVVVWDSEENSLLSSAGQNTVRMQDMQVSSGGTIFLPFVGTVHIAGLPHAAARTRVQRKYEEVIPSAQVQLNIQQGTRGTISMVSGVTRPGPILVDDPNFTVLNAISAAGGPSAQIPNPQLKLIRGSKTYCRPLETVVSNPAYDTLLLPGDKVAVENDERYFRSLGAASREAIVPFDKPSISALDAMSLIGGLSDLRANPKGILVLREYPQNAVRSDTSGPRNARSVFVIDLTSADGLFSAGKFDIQHQDTVLVTESSVASATLLFTLIKQMTGAAFDVRRL
ncbi:polysaccharide biosynthesis/export family protein [Aliiroseovarius sp. F47248L]|uniref:polysaccharide biosynthesis/export family protein n=1 Tax=Aliiroseovarius sp. F47248L TaxID=2926420 RepID=UPI001FF5C570|nr:polysaccharide biosynthesis/export family protein [Aliiroseovarius sp. F47248L]MCK0140358.1 polysaccharide export protein [Aliiroseovarius sp. F47248L]